MYCVKCRQKRDAENVQEVTMKNGKKASKGTCPVCRWLKDNPDLNLGW